MYCVIRMDIVINLNPILLKPVLSFLKIIKIDCTGWIRLAIGMS